MIPFKEYILMEGGAAGRMTHPFDLPSINTGKDLINFFNKAVVSLTKKPMSVKIDGINASVKLITNEDRTKEFAFDRGSRRGEEGMLDMNGVTIDKLEQRFKSKTNPDTGEVVPHGMVNIGKTVLTIFNKTLPTIVDELRKLGMYNNSSVFLNTEYVENKSNVIGYGKNFLAIHGLNKFFNKRDKQQRVISRESKEIPYNKTALLSLVEKLDVVAKKYNFNVIHTVETSLSKPITFDDVLNTNLTFNYSKDHSETKTMKAWLEKCKNPRRGIIKLKDGKRVDPFNTALYMQIINGAVLNDIMDEKDANTAVCGTIIYHATKLLGKKLLTNLESEMGSVDSQEGVVIRDKNISSVPVKITGDFMLRRLESPFQKR